MLILNTIYDYQIKLKERFYPKILIFKIKIFCVVEFFSGIASSRPMINFQGCVVGGGTRLSTMTIGLAQDEFSKFHQKAYLHLGTLI